MTNLMTRRDFLNGLLLGSGAFLLELPSPAELFAQTSPDYGFGGIGDYAASNGNIPEILDIYRSIQNGHVLSTSAPIDTEEKYDLVIVGGGLSGLGAAYEFKKSAARHARCLILENHPVFGGAAKRNEFIVDGVRLIGPQASNAFGVIDRPEIPGYDIYRELDIPLEFEYGVMPDGLRKLDFDTTNFGYRLWFDSGSIGHYFAGQKSRGGWAAGIWERGLEGTPYSDRIRKDFIKWRSVSERQYTGEDYEKWLDSITYKQYMEKVLGLDPEVTRYADPVLASVVGLGCDVISAYAARQVSMPGFPEFQGHRSLKKSHWHSFPGGNDGFARSLVKSLIPESIDGSSRFADIQNRRINFGALDRTDGRVRIRLGSSVLRVDPVHDAKPQGYIAITYHRGGRHYRLMARSVIMACGSHISGRIVAGLPSGHADAYRQFHVSPILVANVALTNWRFLYKLGFTACKWLDGFGFGCNIRKPMYIGSYRPPLHPDKPTILTFYVSFQKPGFSIEDQGEAGRKMLLGTSYAEFEGLIIKQMKQLFSGSGFQADNDIAGIILNRWTYAYVNPQPGFYFGNDGAQPPRDIVRRPFGRIAFAHAELNGHQHWVAAVDEGRRAARQSLSAP